jgi:hypothetical protein
MSLTYGYDPKAGDKILEAPVQANGLLSPLLRPGAALVNHLPFCAITRFISTISLSSDIYFKCGTFPHGSHISATNHLREKLES